MEISSAFHAARESPTRALARRPPPGSRTLVRRRGHRGVRPPGPFAERNVMECPAARTAPPTPDIAIMGEREIARGMIEELEARLATGSDQRQ